MVLRRRRFEHSEPIVTNEHLAVVRSLSRPLRSPTDLDPLLNRIGDAGCVLLGASSYGTHEYYTWRAEISKRLIEEKGFSFIAVDGDWPDCYRLNRLIHAYPASGDNARQVLHAFVRWPTWLLANEELVELTHWLRKHNEGLSQMNKVGFYGLDVYCLWDSLYQVVGYLGEHDPSALPAARQAFQCFDPSGLEAQGYPRATRWADASCEDDIIAKLTELRHSVKRYPNDGEEGRFDAEQNALLVREAEHYYRTMMHGGSAAWNMREHHMMETLERLLLHHEPGAKAIVWEHNLHVGDARFADMTDNGLVNIGQLARQRFGEGGVVLVGFGSHSGDVIASREWDTPMEQMEVPWGWLGSWEDILHRANSTDQLLMLAEARGDARFMEERGHRAIGVVYSPEHEAFGHYVPTVLPRCYDAFLFFACTKSLRPLHVKPAQTE